MKTNHGGLRLAAILFLLTMLFGAAGTARADTDYRCLSDCLGGGTAGSRCLASCTYQKIPTGRPQSEFNSAHNQFDAPTPSSQLFLDSQEGLSRPGSATPGGSLSPTTQPLGPSTNFTCVRNCTARGYQYGLCLGSCSY